MDLQISVFLLFILFTAGHSLDCYECMGVMGFCENETLKSCPDGFSECESSTIVTEVGFMISNVKTKDCSPACQRGAMNFGFLRMSTSCCNKDECNTEDAPDPSNVLNGKTCYSCYDKTCSSVLKCSGTEDHCIKATGNFGGQPVVVKGCVSKSICDNKTLLPHIESISCCEGNLCNCDGDLCNGAQSVTQSFLFLCCSLLSYFLLH